MDYAVDASSTHAQMPELEPTCKPDSPVHPEAVLFPARAALTLADLKWAVMLQGVLGLQALQAGVCAEGGHRLFRSAVLQEPVKHLAGLHLDAALLGHQTVQGCRNWNITWKTGWNYQRAKLLVVKINSSLCSWVYGPCIKNESLS